MTITLKDCSQCITIFLPVYLIFNKSNIIRTKPKVLDHECLPSYNITWLFRKSKHYVIFKNNNLTSKTATYMIFKCIHLCSWLMQEIMRTPLSSLCDNFPICLFDIAFFFKFSQRLSNDGRICLDRTKPSTHFMSNKTKIHVYSKVDTHIIMFRELFGRRDAWLGTFNDHIYRIYDANFAFKSRQNSLLLP